MKIAIIGTGRMGNALVKTFYQAYPHQVYFAGRDIEKTQRIINDLGLNITAASVSEALAADIIIPTLWYADIFNWLMANKNLLENKILIDITNPFNDDFDDFVIPFDTSSAEEIQKVIPKTNVVGAFKNTFWVVFDNPIFQGLKSDIFVTSNDEEARETIIRLLKNLPFRVLDGGRLKNNRTIERMTLLSRELAMKAGNHPRISFNLWGLEHEGLG